MIIKNITDYLESQFPLSLAYEWDSCGLQIGTLNTKVDKIMIVLTIDLQVIEECIEKGVQLLISHHPLFFNPIQNIETDSPMGQIISLALRHHITIYSLHTCMDRVSMNVWLMEAIGVYDSQDYNEEGLVKTAFIEETLLSLIERVKKSYSLNTVAYIGDLNQPLHRLAIIGGSGSDLIEELAGKVDVLITGDIKYHDAQNALAHQLCLIDVGHFVEHIMVKKTKELLAHEFSCSIFESQQKNYIHYR